MLPEIMQSCLIDWTRGNEGEKGKGKGEGEEGEEWDERKIDEKVDREVRRGLGDLLRLDVTVDQAKRELKLRAVGLKAFRERYISSLPKVRFLLSYYPILSSIDYSNANC